MKSIDLLTRRGFRVAVVGCTALAVGLLSIVSAATGAVGLEAQQSGAQALQPSRVDLDGEPLRISVPSTWQRVTEGRTLMFAPENGLGKVAGKAHVSYGIELGMTRTTRRDPNSVFGDIVQAFKSTNPALSSASTIRSVTLAGRFGLRCTFANTSPVTGLDEFVVVAAVRLENERALYVIGVAPHEQFAAFRPTLEAILVSIETAR